MKTMDFGDKLKQYRINEGLSQEQLAEKMSVSRSAIAKWETDKGLPDVGNLKVLARLLNVSVDHLLDEFGAVRAGRANPKVLDRITVEYYGSETPLNGVATISTPDARTLVIQPWDTKLLKDIQKAIQTSELGINPQNDGRVIRLVFPQLTEERRKELTKQVKKYAEDAKVAMRNIRRDGMDYVKKLKKNSEITEDDQKKAEKDLQDLLDKHIKRVDEALAAKEKELMAL